MRAIKFRVWDTKSKKFLTENIVIRLNGRVDETSWGEIMGEECGCVLQQYTGFKDKDGVEIYEGDIIEFEDGKRYSVSWNEDEGYWRVDYEDKENGFDYDCLSMNGGKWNGPVKVVGHINE